MDKKYHNGFETLSQTDAVVKWRKGKYVWNKEIAKNPKINIDFSGFDFPKDAEIDFSGFIFPEGVTDFSNAKFSGNAKFSDAKFSGNAYFSGAKFSGYTSFFAAQFSGKAIFSRAKFIGHAYFNEAKFRGDADFSKAQFSEDTDFRWAKFSGDAYFNEAKFSNMALFTDLKAVKNIKSFSFRYAVFDRALAISSDGIFPCLIDLIDTKTAHHVSLDGVKCTLPREAGRKFKPSRYLSVPLFKILPKTCFKPIYKYIFKGDWLTQKTATDKEDIARARRLKELAESNKSHHEAQNFHVLEMQANRKFNIKRPYAYLLETEFWFEKLGDYGRSITRPIKWFIAVMIFFAGIYAYISGLWIKSFIYSASQMLAFIPASRGARDDIQEALFGKPMPDYIYLLNFTQSLFALILLFLFGLAIRHRYRI